ncbi:MAG: hypothetical protein ABF289_09325, partial [Clostridiales bacterium]
KMPEGSDGFLTGTKLIKDKIYKISEAQLRIDNSLNNILKKERIVRLIKDMEADIHSLRGFKYPLDTEFVKAYKKWLEIANEQMIECDKTTKKEKISQIYNAGEAVKRDKDAFVNRTSVVKEMEDCITSEAGCSGIVLYGRRRVGKTTIFYNLDQSLENTFYNIIYVDMQESRYNSTFINGFIFGLYEKIMPFADIETSKPNNVQEFYELIKKCNSNLISKNRYLLICIDEFEFIHMKIDDGTFEIDLLSTIRLSVQNCRNIIWIFGGSHKITELEGVNWTSYLISLKTIEVPFFTLDEVRTLLVKPYKFSGINEIKDTKIEIWNDELIDIIYKETAGWPFFVQEVANKAIVFLNENNNGEVLNKDLLEMALEKVTESVYNNFNQLLNEESKIEGEWDYILNFSENKFQNKPSNYKIRESLKRRYIVDEVNGKYKLKVPLMERWLKCYFG